MIRNPLYIIPTLLATKRTLEICESLYSSTHHKHGSANAFRHALWNLLISKKLYEATKNYEKSIRWAERITDLHEELAPNKPLEKAMDLHNNRLGRSYFGLLKTSSEAQIVIFLENRVLSAIKVNDLDYFPEGTMELVYISEESG